jgi:hypothetical protein
MGQMGQMGQMPWDQLFGGFGSYGAGYQQGYGDGFLDGYQYSMLGDLAGLNAEWDRFMSTMW